MNLEDLAERFEARRFGSRYNARCPAHNDKSPSLRISEGEGGKLLVKCMAGCETEAVLAAVGLSMVDLFPESEGRRDRSLTAAPWPQDAQADRIAADITEQARRYGMPAPALFRKRMGRFGSYLPREMDVTRGRVVARLRGKHWAVKGLSETALANGWDYDRIREEAECLPAELQERVLVAVFSERIVSAVQRIDAEGDPHRMPGKGTRKPVTASEAI